MDPSEGESSALHDHNCSIFSLHMLDLDLLEFEWYHILSVDSRDVIQTGVLSSKWEMSTQDPIFSTSAAF